jgi:hypothetical protein
MKFLYPMGRIGLSRPNSPFHFSPPGQPAATVPCRSHRAVGPTSQRPQPESMRAYAVRGFPALADWRAPSVRIIFPKQLHANPWGAQRTARSSGKGLCRRSREESGSSQPPRLFPLHISIGAISPSHAATTPRASTAGIGRRSDHHSRISRLS